MGLFGHCDTKALPLEHFEVRKKVGRFSNWDDLDMPFSEQAILVLVSLLSIEVVLAREENSPHLQLRESQHAVLADQKKDDGNIPAAILVPQSLDSLLRITGSQVYR